MTRITTPRRPPIVSHLMPARPIVRHLAMISLSRDYVHYYMIYK